MALLFMLAACAITVAQDQKPISKVNLLSSLEIGKRERRQAAWYVERIRKYGLDFQMTDEDELKIRQAGRYLGVKGLVDLLAAIKESCYYPAKCTGDYKLEFARIVLASEEHWEPVVDRNSLNIFYLHSDRTESNLDVEKGLAKERGRGKYICPGLFWNDDWCRRVSAFFSQQRLETIAIDPKFDILVTNKAKESVVIHTIGIEIAYAEHITVTLGDWETKRVKVDGQYQIQMPLPPAKWRVDGEDVDIGTEIKQRIEDGQPVTADFIRRMVSPNYEWPNLPMTVTAPPADPIYLEPGAPYRFELVLKDYHRMPNNVVVRFILGTNYGQMMSGYIYLLAM